MKTAMVTRVYRTLRVAAMSPTTWRASALMMSVVLVAVCMPAMGAPTTKLGDIGTDLATQSKGMAQGAVYLLALAGIVLGGVGLHKITQARKSQEGMGAGVTMLIAGSLMVALPLVINVMTSSTIQDSASGLGDLGITG